MTYACSTWFTPEDTKGYKGQRDYAEKALSSVQKEALRVATGAFRTTALEVLEAETLTIPIRQRLQKVCYVTALRIRGTPLYQKMIQYRQQVRDKDWSSKRVAPLQRLETGNQTGWTNRGTNDRETPACNHSTVVVATKHPYSTRPGGRDTGA